MARSIELTVASIFTTTPFFRPPEACIPVPIISISPFGLIAPTIATTLDVPISRATIIFCSLVLAILFPHLTTIIRGQ